MKFFDLSLEDKIIFSLVAILLFFLPYSEALKNFSAYCLIILFIIKVVSQNIKITYDVLNISLILHLIIVLIGIWTGINFNESMNQFMDVVHIVLIFLFFREINLHFLSYEKILNILFVGFILAALIGLYDLFFKGYRLNLHSVGSVNRSAVYIMYIFVASLCLISNYKGKSSRLIFTITLTISFISIILGASRMAILSLPLVILYYLYLSRKVSIKSVSVTLFVFIVLSSLIYLIFPDSLIVNKVSLGIYDIPRIQIWVSSIKAWMQNSLWLGIGVGNSIFINVENYFNMALTSYIDNAHNVYLDMLLERGIFGLLSLLTFLASILFYKCENKKVDIMIKTLVFSLLIMGLANITFRYEFALLFAVLVGAYLNPSIIK